MRQKGGVVSGQLGDRQLPRNARLGGPQIGLRQSRGATTQPRRQGGPPPPQHDMQRRTLSPPGTTETRRDQRGDLVGHTGNVLEIGNGAGHGRRLDGMEHRRQTP